MRYLLSIPFWSDFIYSFPSMLWYKNTRFQSHFGLILSYDFSWGTLSQIFAFNPILVWFYQAVITAANGDVVTAFNPILVWFYQGSTERFKRQHQCLSIPFWSDFITAYYSTFDFLMKLSIPFWSDFILPDDGFGDEELALSIPFWSDFILPLCRSLRASACIFQSHFGLILSLPEEGKKVFVRYTFNPILVWFYRQTAPSGSGSTWNNFQSHFGLILSKNLFLRKYRKRTPFNPILVWFYPFLNPFYLLPEISPFNPILVWFYQITTRNT